MFADTTPVDTTSYCLHGTMSDGTYTRERSAAANNLRLGTKIRITSKKSGPGGLRLYVIRDHIGSGTSLDLWTNSCRTAYNFGRHTLRYKRGWGKP